MSSPNKSKSIILFGFILILFGFILLISANKSDNSEKPIMANMGINTELNTQSNFKVTRYQNYGETFYVLTDWSGKPVHFIKK